MFNPNFRKKSNWRVTKKKLLSIGKQHNKWKVLQYFTVPCFRPIGGHFSLPWPKMWLQMPSTTTMTFVSHVMWHIKWKVRPFNVLDQLEVIWHHHGRKCDITWPPWPQQWLLFIPCHVTYQKKGYDFNIRPFYVLDQFGHLTSPWPKMWPQMTYMNTAMTRYHISNEK